MPIQALPALSRCGVAIALLLCSSCGKEREPWYGFDLFPADEAPPDGSAAEGSTDTPDSTGTTGDMPVTSPDTSVGTGSPSQPAAGSGGGPRVDSNVDPGSSGVQTGAPSTPGDPNAPDMAAGPPMAFRITELQLRDPHIFAGSMDLTEQEFLGVSVNRTLIPDKLTKDTDNDGAIDVSVLALLSPYDPTASPQTAPTLKFVSADCPLGGGACSPRAGKGVDTTWTLEQRQSGNCLEPIAGTTSSYQPAIVVPNAPCFQSTAGNDFMMDLGGIQIQVTAARISATYQDAPAGLVRGLLASFVTRSAADAARLPSAAGSTVGGESLSTYIRMRDYDQSASPNGEDGFWMYLNFVAKPIEYAQ
jgi:hypothetical protein